MTKTYDAVVVGSGFGGGTTALRLAQAGFSVCVLERGRRWRGKNLPPVADDSSSTVFPELGDKHFFWGRELWRPSRQRLGLFQMRQMVNLQGLVGAGVGGGSLIWANVVIDAPEWIFDGNWPSDINRSMLTPYYRLADPFLRAQFVPGVRGIPDYAMGRTVPRTEQLRLAAQRLGQRWSPVRIAVNFDDEHNPLRNGHGAARQLGCNYCGLCSAGCPQNAKNTVDKTYIAAAESLGVEVKPLHVVTSLQPTKDGWRVFCKRYDEDGTLAEATHFDCRKLILSAGTFGTTELLLKARRSGALTGLSDALGTRFSFNGNVLSGALRPETSGANVDTNSGPAIGSMIDFGRFVVEDFANPTWAAGIVGASNVGRITSFALALAGRKPTAEALAAKAKDLLVYVGVGADSARGRLALNALGQLSLAWPGGIDNEPVVRELHKAMGGIAHSLGRVYVPNVFSIFNRPLTYHPLGGCPMADTADRGVVDSHGRVFGYSNLFIADGSIVPTAIGRNPSYTIAALAERVSQAIIAEGL